MYSIMSKLVFLTLVLNFQASHAKSIPKMCSGMSCDEYAETQRKIGMIKSMLMKDQDESPVDDPMVSPLDGTLDGCIRLNEKQADMIIVDIENSQNLSQQIGHERKRRKVYDFNKYDFLKWDVNSFPIKYKLDGQYTDLQKNDIRGAISHWEQNTCIRWTEVPDGHSVDEHHIMFFKGSTCTSYVGKQHNSPQPIELSSGCFWRFGTLVHEIGHSLGLWHEQMRFDRDNWITIDSTKVNPDSIGQFMKISSTVGLGVGYDYNSVMHYSPTDGSSLGSPSIFSRDPRFQHNMGQRTGLSFYDAKIINAAYCQKKCQNVLPRQCENLGYLDPNNCDQCKCPDGLSGRYCTDVAPPIGEKCGGTINLSQYKKSAVITSPGYDKRVYKEFIECNWLINAPPGQRVKISFYYDFGLFAYYGGVCYHWLEVRYQENIGMNGPRFCGKSKPDDLTSDKEKMLLVFRSNYTTSWYNRRGFKATVRLVKDYGVDFLGNKEPEKARTTTTTTTITTEPTSTTTPTEPTTTLTTTTPVPTEAYSNSNLGDIFWQCDFEGRSSHSMCDISQSSQDSFDWTIGKGRTPSQETGPEFAYHGSYYIYIEASSPRRRNEFAIMILPSIKPKGVACLKFWYHMYGYHTNTLEVFVQSRVAWKKSKEQGRRWMEAEVDLYLQRNSQIQFRGIRGNGYSGDIAIDFISIIGGTCKDNQYLR